MKNLKNLFGTLLMAALLFTSCESNDDADPIIIDVPNAQDFANVKQNALDNLTQTFQFSTDDSNVSLTSERGVEININTNCLTLNGDPVTGTIDLEYVEIFEKGNMLTTNKPTMGALPSGDKALLISGGEFFIEASQNGQVLETTCTVQLIIPTELTGGADNDMTLWEGRMNELDNLTWNEVDNAGGQGDGGVFAEGGSYYAFLNQFGWNNVDRFYNDPRPKTTILVSAPEGYDNTNSAVYLSYDGEDTGLANLDTYDSGTELFSEHYGQVPIGLECQILFVTEDNGNYRYAIKSVTVAEDETHTFTLAETSVVTEAQLVIIINGLP